MEVVHINPQELMLGMFPLFVGDTAGYRVCAADNWHISSRLEDKDMGR